jgi:hypothetical protein
MQGDRLQISEASVRMNKSSRLSLSMVQTLAMTSMAQVQARFALDYAIDPAFFPEWQQNLPELTERDYSLGWRQMERDFGL